MLVYNDVALWRSFFGHDDKQLTMARSPMSKENIPLSDPSKLLVQTSLDCQSVCQSVGVVQSAISRSRTPVVAGGRPMAGW